MEKAEEKFNILIVDDVSTNLKYLGSILSENERYEIEFATSGAEALGWVEEKDFDLILLDVMMPEMDGFEVCRRLKQDERTREIPVIFLTARTETESLVRSFEAGGVDYVTKPFNPLELSARVRTHLTLKAAQNHRQNLIKELETALREVKRLSGLLPICSYCKKIRDDDGYWQQVEMYVRDHSEAEFSHGICPECARKMFPEYLEEDS
ncbi:MAG TPA: response regulator [Desulfobacterales bacterium]|nr:response regulator [Desulfobacterales bacterium]